MDTEQFQKRKTMRLAGANDNENRAVFLTICTQHRRCLLSKIVSKNVETGVLDGPHIELTHYGRAAEKYIKQLSDFYDDLLVES